MPTIDHDSSPAQNQPGSKKFKKWQCIMAVTTVVSTAGLATLIALNWDMLYRMAGYGYTGGFVISALGGATILVPVPMLAVQFALGGVVKPILGPALLGPFYVGAVCALGETLGALTIYLTGLGGAIPFSGTRKGWLKRLGDRVNHLLECRGKMTLFLLSAIMNPFFYPASIAMGASRFGFKRYAVITLSGKLVKCSMIAYAGYFGLKGVFELIGIEL